MHGQMMQWCKKITRLSLKANRDKKKKYRRIYSWYEKAPENYKVEFKSKLKRERRNTCVYTAMKKHGGKKIYYYIIIIICG